jgi:hypothetical protein
MNRVNELTCHRPHSQMRCVEKEERGKNYHKMFILLLVWVHHPSSSLSFFFLLLSLMMMSTMREDDGEGWRIGIQSLPASSMYVYVLSYVAMA